jgi:hypothetical protein
MRFRKKPSAVIEAVQFTEAMRDAHLFDGAPLPEGVRCGSYHVHRELREHYSSSFYVETLEGPLMVSLGDWVATGVKGERYPIKPDVFAATYEPVGEPS